MRWNLKTLPEPFVAKRNWIGTMNTILPFTILFFASVEWPDLREVLDSEIMNL
jgi:hypothetical protein